MAKYKIVNRRKKSAPAVASPADTVAEALQPAAPSVEESVLPQSGEAAFRLYEEFFTPEVTDEMTAEKEAAGDSAYEKEAKEAPQEAASSPDLIDPESVEPTREFSLEEVRRAFAVAPAADKASAAEPAAEATEQTPTSDDQAPAAAPEKTNEELGAFFAALFGTDSAPKAPAAAESAPVEAPAASEGAEAVFGAAAAVAAAGEAVTSDTVRMPNLPVSSDTIRVPNTEIPEITEHFTPEAAAPVTRANITDLIDNRTEAAESAEAEEDEEEFSRPEQADALLVQMKKQGGALWRRFFGLLILFVAALYLESASFPVGLPLPRPEFLTPGRFGLVYLLCDLQLIVLAVAVAFRQVKSGVSGLFTGKANADSVVFLGLFTALVQLGILLSFFAADNQFVLFGSVSVFLALCGSLRAIFEHRANMLALAILSRSGDKYAAEPIQDENAAELVAFSEHLGEELPEVFSVNKTAFADGFLRRIRQASPAGASFTVILPIALLVSVGISVWCFLGAGSRSAIHGINAFVCSMMMALPAGGIFAHTLPYFFAQRRAVSTGTALLGESAVEEATRAEIVSFDDTEVFLPKHVKVTSVRTYGAARIDKILIYCAQIFRIVGGPLSYVFENSISSLSVPGVVEILENEGDGICARIDGKEIYLGSSAYMESYEFPVEIDESDATFENTVGRIMYLAADGELCAKFYIKYAVSARFCAQLGALNRAGIYAAVKTCDPNVDRLLLQKILGNPEYPIGVIKTGSSAKNAPAAERADAPVVGTAKISGVLNGFLLCEAVRSRAALGALVKTVSMLLGLFISFLLLGMQNAFLTPVICLLYQLLWLMPVVVPALFDWPSPPRKAKRRR